jgi:hypothetical protein
VRGRIVVLWFEYEVSTRSMYSVLGPQLVVLLWEVVETLGNGT